MNSDANRMVLDIHTPKPKHPVMKEINKRFSPRLFSEEHVDEKDILSIMEAARWAPSGHNMQPWFYYLAKKGTKPYEEIFSTLSAYNRSWAKSAPLLILACAIIKNEKGKNPFALYDLGSSVMSLILQAQSLGYYARQMGLFDKKKIRSFVKMEPFINPYIIIALGKIGNFNRASKLIMEYELDPRPRKIIISKQL